MSNAPTRQDQPHLADPGAPAAGKLYVQNLSGCFIASSTAGGGGAGGFSKSSYHGWLDKLAPPLDQLQRARHDGTMPLLNIVDDSADIEAAEAAYAALAEGARTIVFFGTGGSSLGGQTLAQLGGWFIPGVRLAGQKSRPRTRFYDNLDAQTLAQSLSSLDLASTRFIVVSKSGGTAETLVQGLSALQAVREAGLGAEIPRLFLGLTQPARPGVKNGLRDLCDKFGIPMLDHPVGIGGRYGALSNVGLLPAIARGLDVRAVRAGARAVIDDMMLARSPAQFAPAQGAAVAAGLAIDAGIRTQIVMPYSDKLERFSHWFVQLWAESLGKNGKGTTPMAALGPRDQHSLLQLFMDGPKDHLITMISVADSAAGAPPIQPELARLAGIEFLAGRTAGELVGVQVAAVSEALRQAGRPVRNFTLPKLDERAMGALMMHFMLETIFAGALLDVDPFDQPAVELAKQLTKARLECSRED